MATLVTLPNGHFALENNLVYYFPIQDEDVNNHVVSPPAGDVVSAAGTGPHATSLSWSVGVMPAAAPNAGVPVVIGAALVAESDAGNGGGGIGLMLTDTSGLTENATTSAALFDIVVPPPGPATQEGVDFANIFTTSQPTPTAPGP